jgi:ubiquinone/menaquinone biosynthesis C-methylase UbiE
MDISHYESMYKNEKTHWWYKVRRIFVQDLLKRFDFDTNTKILDVGCGTGELMIDLGGKYNIYGMDFSSVAIDFCKRRGINNIRVGDITEIPFEDKTFDCVLALDILEHVENDRLAICELNRVLRSGGKAIIFVPAFMIMWGITDELSHHFRRYRINQISSLFIQNGFKIKYRRYFNSFLFIPILLVRLMNRYFLKSKKNENEYTHGLMNKVLEKIFYFEIKLLKFIKPPFGVSICIVAEKTKK